MPWPSPRSKTVLHILGSWEVLHRPTDGMSCRQSCRDQRTRSLRLAIQFVEHQGTFIGTSQGGRLSRISRALTGWRLAFRDGGDRTATYTGVHRSVTAAQAEAAR